MKNYWMNDQVSLREKLEEPRYYREMMSNQLLKEIHEKLTVYIKQFPWFKRPFIYLTRWHGAV